MNYLKTLSAASAFGLAATGAVYAQDGEPKYEFGAYETLCPPALEDDANALEFLRCFDAVSENTWDAIEGLENNNVLDRDMTDETTWGNDSCRSVYRLTAILDEKIRSTIGSIENDDLAAADAGLLGVHLPDLLYHAGVCANAMIWRVEDRSPSEENQRYIDVLSDIAAFGMAFPEPRF